MSKPRTVYMTSPHCICSQIQKKTRVAAKRSTLVLDFSPKRSGLFLDQLSVNYCFSAAYAPLTFVRPIVDLALNNPATPLGSLVLTSAGMSSVAKSVVTGAGP